MNKREEKKKPEIFYHSEAAECPSPLWFELGFQSPERTSYNLLLPQCPCYNMHLIVNLSHRAILEHSDATVTFVTGASEAQNISESIVVSLNKLWVH